MHNKLHMNKLESPGPKDALCQISMHLIKVVVHVKKIIKDFCYINLYPLSAWPFMIPGKLFEQIGQWFMRRRLLKVFYI